MLRGKRSTPGVWLRCSEPTVERGLTSEEARSSPGPRRAQPGRPRRARPRSGDWPFRSSRASSSCCCSPPPGVAMALGEVVEGLVILAALLLNAAIGFLTEWRARRSLARLRALVVLEARVRRDGQVTTVPAAELVPGDVVLLEAGVQVPADARLVRCTALRIDESALDGREPRRSTRMRTRLSRPRLRWPSTRRWSTSAPRCSPARGAAIVTATGVATQLGRLGQLVALAGDRATPLERQVEGLGRRLIGVALGACAVVTVAGILHGQPVGLMLETGITLAGRGHSRGAAGGGGGGAGRRALAAGAGRRPRPASAGRRDARLHHGDLRGQDRDHDRESDDGRAHRARRPASSASGGSATSPRGAFTEHGRPLDPARRPALLQLLTVAALVNDAAVQVGRLRRSGCTAIPPRRPSWWPPSRRDLTPCAGPGVGAAARGAVLGGHAA